MDNIIININSQFRNTSSFPSSSDFTIKLEEEIKNIIYIKLSSLELPLYFHSFTDIRNNNSFTITNGANTDTITIGDGNFTTVSILTKINARLDEINTTRTVNLDLNQDSNTGKITFTSSSSFTLNFNRTGNIDYKGIKYHLGFSNDTYTGTSITSETPLDINVDRYLFLNINDIQNIRDNKVNNAFSKIIVNTNSYSLLVRGPEEYVSKDIVLRSPINLSKLDIKLLDYLGNTIDLGKNDFSLTLELGYVYDKKLYEEIHNKGIPNGDTRTKFFY
jgi:hypothetical protein